MEAPISVLLDSARNPIINTNGMLHAPRNATDVQIQHLALMARHGVIRIDTSGFPNQYNHRLKSG